MIKKLLLTICLLLFSTIAVQATEITVGSSQWFAGSYRYSGSVASLRIYYSQSFLSNTNVNVVGGAIGSSGWYKSVSCTVSSATLDCASFTLQSTVDSNKPNTRFFAVLYDQSGARRETLMGDASGWIVPASPTSTTVAILQNSQGTGIPNPPTSYLNSQQVQALITAQVGTQSIAAQGTLGRIETATAPLDAVHPKAIEIGDPKVTADQAANVASIRTLGTGALQAVPGNDPRVTADQAANVASIRTLGTGALQAMAGNDSRVTSFSITAYGASTAGTAAANATAIAAAVTAASAAGSGIFVPLGTFSTNSVTISVPVTFAPGASILSVITGQTLTITKEITADINKHFANVLSGQGTLSLAGNAFVNEFPVEWIGTLGDGSTDDTPYIQRILDMFDAANKSGNLLFQSKVYIINGALQDPGVSDSQIVLPKRPTTNLAIGFVGVPPNARTLINVDTAGTIIKSTLATGNGAMIGTSPRSFVNFYTHNITYRMPVNPTNSCLNMSEVALFTFGNLKVDTGEVFDATTQPTTTTSYGILMPQNNQASATRGDSVTVAGFYTPIKGGELTNINMVTVANGFYALETPAAFHPNWIGHLLIEHCKHGIIATGGASSWVIDLLDIEKATSGWYASVDDISDASDFLYARITWHVVTVSSGVTHTLTKVGGANVYDQELQGTGTEIFTTFNSQTPKLLEINSNKAVSGATNVPWLSMVHNQSSTSDNVGCWSGSNLAIGAAEKRIGQICFVTDAAVNTGKIFFTTSNAGTASVKWAINGAGNFLTATDGVGNIGGVSDNRPNNVYVKTAVVAGSVRGTAVAFASLPASPVEGMMVGVTDSNTNTWGATIAGGGANHVLAYYNGTNWTVAAK